MHVKSVRRFGAGALLAAGAAIAAAGMAHADAGTEQINGWTIQTGPVMTGGASQLAGEVAKSATLLDPTDSLGLGKEISGSWADETMFGFIKESGFTAVDDGGSQPVNLHIIDTSVLGMDQTVVTVIPSSGGLYETEGIFLPTLDGKSVVDLVEERNASTTAGFAPHLFNPAATGPLTMDGLTVASPQDGSLYADVYSALFKGDAADWGKAATLVDDLLGIDPSGSADAVDAAGWLPSLDL